MKLGIISDCVHFYTADGRVATENHILLRQLQTLSDHFDEVLICCPFAMFDAKAVYTVYEKPNINFIALPNVGGNTAKEKFRLLTAFPKWFKAYKAIDRFSDVVYQRFPNNLNIPGFFYFYLKNKKVFATYTGTWSGYVGEPATYRFQRMLLDKYFKGPVWAYINSPQANHKIKVGISPSYSKAEWDEETTQVNRRIERLKSEPLKHVRLITVGTLISYKNQLCILRACVILRQRGISFNLNIVGDGPMRTELQEFIIQNKLDEVITLCGKKNHVELRDLYRNSDLVVQAPLSEGFGKVPIEGFFHGVIPVVNNIAMASAMTGNEERGFLFDARNPSNLAEVIIAIPQKQPKLPAMIANGREYARSQTLEAWASDYYNTVTQYFGKT